MASIIDGVDQRTQLAGHNRLELLLFELHNGQTFGINVFKVREAIPCPALTKMPRAHAAITKVDSKLVEIIDVEKVLAEVIGMNNEVSKELSEDFSAQNEQRRPHILVADDSGVARKQIARTMTQIGIDTTMVQDGKEALEQLQRWQNQGIDVKQHIALLISDIEMPEMDGYSLTTAVRKAPELQTIQILLHSSMSGEFNELLVEKVGAKKFIAKFNPDELASTVQDMVSLWLK